MLGWHLKSSVLPCFPKAAMCGGKVQPPGSNVFCLHISGLGIEVTGPKALQVGLCDLSEQSTDPGSAGDAVPLAGTSWSRWLLRKAPDAGTTLYVHF